MNILHLEYSQFFRKIIQNMIDKSSNTAFSSNQGADAFQILARKDIDLILTGLELADMTGEELIRTLKDSRYKDIPIVLITSLETEELKSRIKGLKVSDILYKNELTQDSFESCVDRFDR